MRSNSAKFHPIRLGRQLWLNRQQRRSSRRIDVARGSRQWVVARHRGLRVRLAVR